MAVSTEHNDKMEVLKHLLMDEDLEHIDRIDDELKEILDDFYKADRFQNKVDPLIETRLLKFQKDIPDTMGPAITAALRKQVKESQKEVVDALYPLIGRMIAKYIRKEIEALSKRIDDQFEQAFSLEGWERRIKAWFSGSKESELIMRETMAPVLEEVFVIRKGSGILLGKYSKEEQINADMIAGMLTAIKAFSEDAFHKDKDELEMIEYESYKIKIFNIGSFYVATVISGILTAEFESKLREIVLELTEDFMGVKNDQVPEPGSLNEKLKTYFDGASI